jgi:hypothetical protein
MLTEMPYFQLNLFKLSLLAIEKALQRRIILEERNANQFVMNTVLWMAWLQVDVVFHFSKCEILVHQET